MPLSYGMKAPEASHGCPLSSTSGLLLFSAAAPATAILIYMALSHLSIMADQRNAALCVLFSAGTVLHACMVHVLPPILHSEQSHPASQPHRHKEVRGNDTSLNWDCEQWSPHCLHNTGPWSSAECHVRQLQWCRSSGCLMWWKISMGEQNSG